MTMPSIRRTVAIAAWTVSLALAHGAPALAAWSPGGAGSAGGAAAVMPGGLAPSGTVGGDFVTVSWPAVTFADGEAIAGYLVNRYDASNGAMGTVSGTCAGVVAATSCVDDPVPVGSWVYTVTPVEQSWTGAESPDSAVVVVHLS